MTMTLTARCHCGATRITFPDPTDVRRCNCTFCSRLGGVWAYMDPAEAGIEAEHDQSYSATGLNQHHFCGRCGNHTHGLSPDWSSTHNADGSPRNGDPNSFPTAQRLQVNLAMVLDLDLSRFDVQELDGRNAW